MASARLAASVAERRPLSSRQQSATIKSTGDSAFFCASGRRKGCAYLKAASSTSATGQSDSNQPVRSERGAEASTNRGAHLNDESEPSTSYENKGDGSEDDRGPSVDWSELPLDQLKRPGETAWGPDPDGPIGAERFDNRWDRDQEELNSAAIEAIGMGTWRLQGAVSPLTQLLVANIEGAFRHMIDDLGLHPLPKAWRYIDSLDPDGKYGSWSYQDLEPPQRGEAGWPRLQIENRCYRSRVFRKLHLEVAHRQDDLEVLHCVMYPYVQFDLPILSLDVVASNGVVSLGIVDPCPVALDRSLSPAYVQICRTLQREFQVETNRAVPDWGREIFSEHCVMMRPTSDEELSNFVKYVIALTRVHLRLAHNTDPVQLNKLSRTKVISAAHERYRDKQLLNSKTRRVLESAFSKQFAEEYMTGLMFDKAPEEKPSAPPNGAASEGVPQDLSAARAGTR